MFAVVFDLLPLVFAWPISGKTVFIALFSVCDTAAAAATANATSLRCGYT